MEKIIRREDPKDPDYEKFDNEDAAAVLVAKSTENVAK